jgi:hypothetical protein
LQDKGDAPRVLRSRGCAAALVSISKQKFGRLDVLLRVQSGRLWVSDACVLIGLQRRQVFRLLGGLEQDGPASLLSKRLSDSVTIRSQLRCAPWHCRSCASDTPTLARPHAFAGAGVGGGEADRASRLLGLTRDLARLDDCGRAGAGPSAWSPLAASAAPTA